MTAAVCIAVGLVVVVGVWVVVFALCRQAAFNDQPATPRSAAARVGAVTVVGEDGLPRPDLDALDRAIARDLGAGS